ncbi:hypothetical protein ACFQ0T_25740 [Kitasatospora gansuensis]
MAGEAVLRDESEPYSASGMPPGDEHAFFGHPRGLAPAAGSPTGSGVPAGRC